MQFRKKEIKILKIFLYRNILQRFYNKANHHVMSQKKKINLKNKESAHSNVLQSP